MPKHVESRQKKVLKHAKSKHAEARGTKKHAGRTTPATKSAAASQAPKPVQARQPVPSVPRLPRKTIVDMSLCHACHVKRRDVRLCHACHTKCRGVTGAQARPSAPPSAICPTTATQSDSRCKFVPRLPRETIVDVSLCHACHAKCRGVTGDQIRPSAPPSAISATPAMQNDGRCEIVPRVPREPKVDVKLLYVKFVCYVCVCVKLLYVKFVC